MIRAVLTFVAATMLAPAAAAQPSQPAATGPVTAEYYYRIKWGSAAEFKALYDRNHAPILKALMKRGLITSIKTEEPLTHLAGGQRWDLRVTITYPEAASAVVVGGAYDAASAAVVKRLYPDKAKFDSEEARRFSLLEEHWDVIVIPVAE